MAEKDVNINVNVKSDKALGTVKEFRSQMIELRRLQIEYNKAVESGDKALQASLQKRMSSLVQLQNDIKDTRVAMKYLDPGELLSGWVKFGQGVVGSFAAVTGAMSLFGVENENLQAIEKKSMVLIQTMMGLEQARALFIDQAGKMTTKTLIGQTALRIKEASATAVQTVAQKGATLATSGATVATRALGVAMKSLPIMWLVAGLGAIAGAVYGLVQLFKDDKSALEDLADSQKETFDEMFKNLAQFKIMEDNIKATTVGTRDHVKAVNEYNEAAKKQNLFTLDVNASLTEQNSVLETNNKLIMARTVSMASQNEIMKAYEEIIKLQIAKNKELADGDKEDAKIIQYMILQKQDEIRQIQNLKKVTDEYVGSQEDRIEKEKILGNMATAAAKSTAKQSDQNVKDNKKEADAWKSKYDAAQEHYKKIVYDSKTAREKLFIDYQKDTGDYKKNLDSKLWSQDQYSAALLIRQKQYEEDRLKLIEETNLKYIEKEKENNEKLIEERKISLDDSDSENTYIEDVKNWDISLKDKLAILKDFTKDSKITQEDANKAAAELIDEQVKKYSEAFAKIGSQISSIFSNLTQISMMEIENQDSAWQKSFEKRNESIDSQLKHLKDQYGEDSDEYKRALDSKTKLDEEKAKHDKLIEEQKRKASKKYAKVQLGIEAAMATAEYAKALAGIWAVEMGTKGVFGAATAPIATGILTGVYATQMALFAKQLSSIEKMKFGGMITGPSHESGGVTRELEGGEAVINKNSMSNPLLRSMASAINQAGGGVSFPNTEPINSLVSVDSQSIANAVINAIKEIPVTVLLDDVNRAQKRVNVIQSKTTF